MSIIIFIDNVLLLLNIYYLWIFPIGHTAMHLPHKVISLLEF